MGYIGSDPRNKDSVTTSQLVDDAVTNAKLVDDVLFSSVTSSIVSASGNITADTFTGTFNGALSSSAQIATSISGSSTSLSSSLSTRATTLESASGSFASDLVTLKGSGTAQGVGTSDSPTFADATITGTLTAQEVHTEFESASVIFTSGSTIFGNSSDDIHNMTGSLNVSGSINLNNGTLTVTNNVDFNGDLDVDGDTTLDALVVDELSTFNDSVFIGKDVIITGFTTGTISTSILATEAKRAGFATFSDFAGIATFANISGVSTISGFSTNFSILS